MSADDYAKGQAERDRRYEEAWASPEALAWIESLPAYERRRLEAEGLLAPMLPKDGGAIGCGLEGDVAEMPMASTTPDIAELVDGAESASNGESAASISDERLWDILRRLLGELLSHANARLAIECLAVVSGIGFLGDSMSDIARRHGLGRAAVSKRCVEMTEKLGLPPSRAMRSLTARRSYARTQHRIRKHHEQRNRRRRR